MHVQATSSAAPFPTPQADGAYLRDDHVILGDGHALPGLHAPQVVAERVLELLHADVHAIKVATVAT